MIGIVVGLALAAQAAAATPSWKVFAACAAAYEVNAQVADPDRPASMRAMVSEVAADYRTAAEGRLRQAEKLAADAAREAVAAEVADRVAEYRPKPRAEVERTIDACPQIPEGE